MTPIVVVAAVIERDGSFLLTLRPEGTHLAGHWEFPGGKVHVSETHAEALRREIFEELDAVARVGPGSQGPRYPENNVSCFAIGVIWTVSKAMIARRCDGSRRRLSRCRSGSRSGSDYDAVALSIAALRQTSHRHARPLACARAMGSAEIHQGLLIRRDDAAALPPTPPQVYT